jgi:8-oxo-dGTP pyrophosphatase MutT (NUDIX family)
MARFEYGDRIGKTAVNRPSACAVIFDDAGRVLLTRRSDNGRWCMPGGAHDPGESAEECCVRETLEETGLHVRVTRLVGVYSTPHRITIYADGNRAQFFTLSFEAEVVGGELGLSDETTEYGWFTPDEVRRMDVLEPHVERIDDALLRQAAAIIK